MHVSDGKPWLQIIVATPGSWDARRRLRSGSRPRSGECDSDQTRAKQDKTGNGHCEETVGSEFVTHGTLPFARECWLPSRLSRTPARTERLTSCTVKRIPFETKISSPVEDFMQHRPDGMLSGFKAANQTERRRHQWISLSVCANGRPRAFSREENVSKQRNRALRSYPIGTGGSGGRQESQKTLT
jgi:hypothetical protein